MQCIALINNLFPLLYGSGSESFLFKAISTSLTSTNTTNTQFTLGVATKNLNVNLTEATIIRIDEDGMVLWGRTINMQINVYSTSILEMKEDNSEIKILMQATSTKSNNMYVTYDLSGNLILALRYGSSSMNVGWNPKAMTTFTDDSVVIAYEASQTTNAVYYNSSSGVDIGIFRANSTNIIWHIVIDYQALTNSPVSVGKDTSFLYVTGQQTSGILLIKLNQTSGLVSGAIPKSTFIPMETYTNLQLRIDTTNSLGCVCALLTTDSSIGCFKFSLTDLSTSGATKVSGVAISYYSFLFSGLNQMNYMIETSSSQFFIFINSTSSTYKELNSVRPLNNGKMIWYGNNIFYAGDMLKGQSSSYNQTQVAIMKSSQQLDFLTYSCYQPSTSNNFTSKSYALNTPSGLNANGATVSTTLSIINISSVTGFNITNLSTIKSYYPNPESQVYIDITTFKTCQMAEPIFSNLPTNKVYRLMSTTPDDEYTLNFTQCQGIVPQITVQTNLSVTLPFWIDFTTPNLTFRPSYADPQDLGNSTVIITSVPPLSYNATFNVELYNDKPTLSLIIQDDRYLFYGFQPVVVTVALVDPEGDPVFYSLEYANKSDITISVNYTLKFISATTLQYTMFPGNSGEILGVHDIVFYYWDYYHQNDKENFTKSFQVDKNFPPYFVTPPDNLTVMSCYNITYTIPQINDKEGDGYSFSYTGIVPSSSDDSWVTINNMTFTIDPLRANNGDYQLNIQLVDGVNLTQVVPIKLHVEANPYPQYTGPDNFTVSVGGYLNYVFGKSIISDNDLVSSSFQFQNSSSFPSWFSFNSATYSMTIQNLADSNVGVYYGQFLCKDICPDGPSKSQFKIIVMPNFPVTLVGNIADISIYKGSDSITVQFPNPLFNDPENNYRITSDAVVIQGDALNAKIVKVIGITSLEFQADPKFYGIMKVILTAIDNAGHEASTSFKVNISNCKSYICDSCNGPNTSNCK